MRGQASRRSTGPSRSAALNLITEPLAEHLGVEAARVLHTCARIDPEDVELGYRGREFIRAAIPPAPGHAVHDVLKRPPGATGDHRPARGLSLDSRDAELLPRRDHERAAARQQPGRIGVSDAPDEVHGRPGAALESAPSGPVARHTSGSLSLLNASTASSMSLCETSSESTSSSRRPARARSVPSRPADTR